MKTDEGMVARVPRDRENWDDDRSEEQKISLTCAAVGADTILSGWGKAERKTSYAAWACSPEDLDECKKYVLSRSDMRRVRTVVLSKFRVPDDAILHVYIYNKVIHIS